MTDPLSPVKKKSNAAHRSAISYLSATFYELRHGATTKFFAFGSRLLFLLFVVPDLLPGELTHYVFLSSVTIIAARLLGMGLEEQIPLIVSGRVEKLKEFTPVVDILAALQFVLAMSVVITQSEVAALALLTCCYVMTGFLGGVIRTVRLTGAERLRDLHWIAFGLTAFLLPVQWTAVDLVLLMSACLMVAHLLEIHINLRRGIPHEMRLNNSFKKLRQLSGPITLSWRKLIASAMLTILIRAVVLWPKALSLEGIMDDIAYALLLGEAFMQTSMILVYRKFARYCTHVDEFAYIINDMFKTICMLLAYTTFAALFTRSLGLIEFEFSGFSNWSAVSWMVMFFGFLSSYVLVRYVIWVHRNFDWRLTGAELVLVALQGSIVYFLPQDAWPIALAACTALLLIVSMIFARITTRQPSPTHTGS